MNRGFTLVETIIYIALFSILITGCFVTAYSMIESSDKLNTKKVIEEEGNFVNKKLEWAMTGLDNTISPSITGSGCSQKINLTKSDGTIVNFRLTGTQIEMNENGGAYVPVTTVNATANCLKFTDIPANSGAPEGITASYTLNSQDFSVTKYIRK